MRSLNARRLLGSLVVIALLASCGGYPAGDIFWIETRVDGPDGEGEPEPADSNCRECPRIYSGVLSVTDVAIEVRGLSETLALTFATTTGVELPLLPHALNGELVRVELLQLQLGVFSTGTFIQIFDEGSGVLLFGAQSNGSPQRAHPELLVGPAIETGGDPWCGATYAAHSLSSIRSPNDIAPATRGILQLGSGLYDVHHFSTQSADMHLRLCRDGAVGTASYFTLTRL